MIINDTTKVKGIKTRSMRTSYNTRSICNAFYKRMYSQRTRGPCVGPKRESKMEVEIGEFFDIGNILLHLHFLAKLHGYVSLRGKITDTFHL